MILRFDSVVILKVREMVLVISVEFHLMNLVIKPSAGHWMGDGNEISCHHYWSIEILAVGLKINILGGCTWYSRGHRKVCQLEWSWCANVRPFSHLGSIILEYRNIEEDIAHEIKQGGCNIEASLEFFFYKTISRHAEG